MWERPARSDLFPPSVWRFLTKRPDGNPDRATVAEVAVAEWRAGELLGREGPEAERTRVALLFGAGGAYTVEELEARDAMLDLLEASIALMSRDLRMLLEELLGRSAPAPASLVRAPPGARRP